MLSRSKGSFDYHIFYIFDPTFPTFSVKSTSYYV